MKKALSVVRNSRPGSQELDFGLPYNADEAARTAAAAAVTQRIVNRGLVQPLRSSIVRNISAFGEGAANFIALVPHPCSRSRWSH